MWSPIGNEVRISDCFQLGSFLARDFVLSWKRCSCVGGHLPLNIRTASVVSRWCKRYRRLDGNSWALTQALLVCRGRFSCRSGEKRPLWRIVAAPGCIYWCAHKGACVHTRCMRKPAKFHLHGQFNGKLAWKYSISYFMNLIGFSWFYKVLQPDTHGWRLHSRRPKTLHLCFSTLARIHWIWSGMTMHLWNVHSLFSCLIQIKKGGGKKSSMRIPYGNTKLAL